ncbi:DNA polymerase/3'-5' exonuclease PolX [Solimonas variicoloris]|uniref:DNA polymerase/3'-5' exonuclease PolX n=1 Tax=Solimonas variicoloris TaxID=254408 RepID=UPI000366DF64|nr:DNA polymerase/3'-5' exonuclease PolX [Solimonas variicoloris]
MSVSNAAIAAVFEEIADILEIEGANPYRVRAYRNAARTVSAYGTELAPLLARGATLPKMPGIGEDLAGKIAEIAATGSCALRERLHREVPAAIVSLLQVAGIGPKRVKLLYHDLGIETPEQLLEAARAGRVQRLHGFGARTEARLMEALQRQLAPGRRYPLADVAAQGEALAAALRGCRGLRSITVCGSVRRMRDTVGDLDLLAVTRTPATVMRRFLGLPAVGEVLTRGPTRATVMLRSGLQADLRAIAPEAEGAALVYFTGSKAHNIAIRRRAQKRRLKISEYGVFRGARRIAGATEAEVYAAIGLPPIPPELREDRGEIAAAAADQLPRLIERADLRGDLHVHTIGSDGTADLEAMAQAARRAGLQYIAITDHSRSTRVAHGLDEARLLRQLDAIDALNARLDGVVLLKGIEVDILADGRLDLPDRVLGRLDIVVGAVHAHFDLPRRRQLLRLQRALDHRHFHVLAHPSCRLIGTREPLDVDISAVIRSAAQRGCGLELNAQPQRMDLLDTHCREAQAQGVPISIASDAHGPRDFDWLHYGVGQARRGWLRREDVVNTRTLDELRQWLGARSSQASSEHRRRGP